MIDGVKIKSIEKFTDDRGSLAEVFRQDSIDFHPAMAYLSWTNPGVARGPHEHVYQSDCFAFPGPGNFRLHLWDRREHSETKDEKLELVVGVDYPCVVVVPPGVVHGYKCISTDIAMSINFPDRLYKGLNKEEEVDEIRWENNSESPYKIN
ncbi:MAG: WxcM-like domain-containing protein [Patescibacteria group bacterium]